MNVLEVAVHRFPSVLGTGPGTSGSGLMAQPLLLRWSKNLPNLIRESVKILEA